MNKKKNDIEYCVLDPVESSRISGGALQKFIYYTGFVSGTLTNLLQCHYETGNSISFIYQSNFNK